MTTVQEAHSYFVEPLARKFSAPPGANPDEFFSDLAIELARYTRYQLESAAREISRTRTQRGFPTFAECLAAVERQPAERPAPKGTVTGSGDGLEDWKRKRDAERAAALMCNCPLGVRARDEGWLVTLLEYAQTHGRLPAQHEIAGLIERSRRVDESALGCGALTARLLEWRALMKKRAEQRVFGGGVPAGREEAA